MKLARAIAYAAAESQHARRHASSGVHSLVDHQIGRTRSHCSIIVGVANSAVTSANMAMLKS